MERYTFIDKNGFYIDGANGEVRRNMRSRFYGKAIDRLAAYEDTGLEPEEIDGIKSLAVLGLMRDVKRASAIMDAEREGRLLVLPCKVGDTVYVTDGYVRKTKVVAIHQWVSGHWKISIEEPHTTPYWKGYERSFDAFGKTVFLTREEAEAALKEVSP